MHASLVEHSAAPEPPRIVAAGRCSRLARFGQRFALQPRAVCTHPQAAQLGKVLPAAQPACGAA